MPQTPAPFVSIFEQMRERTRSEIARLEQMIEDDTSRIGYAKLVIEEHRAYLAELDRQEREIVQ